MNNRPVLRVAIALWVMAALSCSASLVLYWNYFTSQGQNAETLRTTDAEIERELGEMEELLGRLEAVDLEFQERENEALNQRIAQRVFSWSSLFDRVAEVLPATVSLDRIAPTVKVLTTSPGSGHHAQSGITIVDLSISGTARNDEALLLLIDRLFEHPSFTRPNLSSEKRRESRELDFSMTATFLPEVEAHHLDGQPTSRTGPATVPDGVELSAGSDRIDRSEGDQVE